MKTLAIILWVALISLVSLDQVHRWQKSDSEPSSAVEPEHDNSLLFVDYIDEDYGFSMVVPQGWKRTIVDGMDSDSNGSKLGYSVTFESAIQGDADPYVDYLMVEVLPGTETGAFESDGVHRDVVIIDGIKAVRDEINLADYPFGDATIDLTIRQAEIAQLGFTIGLYAIGTKDNAGMLDEAFGALVYSFEVPDEPFLVATIH